MAALELVSRIATALGIDHAGFDVAVVDGHCYFLEFNVRFSTEALHRHELVLAPAVLHYLQSRADQASILPETPPLTP